MFKLIIISTLLVVVKLDDIDKLKGKWKQIVVFPNIVFIPVCPITYITVENKTAHCTCNDTGELANSVNTITYPVIHVEQHMELEPIHNQSFYVTIVDNTENIDELLHMNCDCEGFNQQYPAVLRFLNDNYFVQYERVVGQKYTDTDFNNAILNAKIEPTLPELRKLIVEEDELKTRDAGLLCDKLRP